MRISDKMISFIFLGLLAPVIFMLAFWWGSVPFLKGNDALIFYLALAGLMIGILLNFTVLRRFIFKLFELPMPALAALEIFYSVMIYGFFMGFPVFNSLVGIAGGYIVARRGVLRNETKENTMKDVCLIERISAFVLLFLCGSSAVLALNESTICSQVRAMLNLPFEMTMGMIWMLILIGGSSLLLFQFVFSKFVSERVMNKAYSPSL